MNKNHLKVIFHTGRIDRGDDPFCGSIDAYDKLIRDIARKEGDERELAMDDLDTTLQEESNGYSD